MEPTGSASSASSSSKRTGLTVCILASRLIENIGDPAYREYRVTVGHGERATWEVWRRFSEFVALRDVLTSKSARAPLPAKASVSGLSWAESWTQLWHNTTDNAANERAQGLQLWLEGVVESDDVASPALLTFLGLATTLPTARTRAPLHVRALIAGDGTGESGDLVLFRTPTTVPAVQRALTRSHWDHVGVLLYLDERKRVCRASECDARYGGEAGIIECNAAGTRFYSLAGYEREWHTLYDEIALRPLLWPGRGTPETCQTLHRWLIEVHGAPYLLTVGKITASFRSSSSSSQQQAANGAAGSGSNRSWFGGGTGAGGGGSAAMAAAAAVDLDADDDADGSHGAAGRLARKAEAAALGVEEEAPAGFFCSELAAHCYQALGVLSHERPALDYWPVSFGEAASKPLPMLQAAHFGNEILIDFDTPAVDVLGFGEERLFF